MTSVASPRVARPTFLQRLAAALAATDRFVSWYGAHRAWPANEPIRIDQRQR